MGESWKRRRAPLALTWTERRVKTMSIASDMDLCSWYGISSPPGVVASGWNAPIVLLGQSCQPPTPTPPIAGRVRPMTIPQWGTGRCTTTGFSSLPLPPSMPACGPRNDMVEPCKAEGWNVSICGRLKRRAKSREMLLPRPGRSTQTLHTASRRNLEPRQASVAQGVVLCALSDPSLLRPDPFLAPRCETPSVGVSASGS